jgi:hypothetical protein
MRSALLPAECDQRNPVTLGFLEGSQSSRAATSAARANGERDESVCASVASQVPAENVDPLLAVRSAAVEEATCCASRPDQLYIRNACCASLALSGPPTSSGCHGHDRSGGRRDPGGRSGDVPVAGIEGGGAPCATSSTRVAVWSTLPTDVVVDARSTALIASPPQRRCGTNCAAGIPCARRRLMGALKDQIDAAGLVSSPATSPRRGPSSAPAVHRPNRRRSNRRPCTCLSVRTGGRRHRDPAACACHPSFGCAPGMDPIFTAGGGDGGRHRGQHGFLPASDRGGHSQTRGVLCLCPDMLRGG